MDSTQDKIKILFNNGKDFLLAKNIKYGDSAISPIQIFSKEDPENQICNRIDDKLSRIKNSADFRKNDLVDLWGYISLLLIKKDWINFEDLID